MKKVSILFFDHKEKKLVKKIIETRFTKSL